jgi:xanthine dehydrogenase accessory factor
MNCGGSQTVVTHPCRQRDGAAIKVLLHSLVSAQPGTLQFSNRGLHFTPQGRQRRRLHDPAKPEAWSFTERIRVPDTLYLIGGGHVALALSRVAATLDFRIVVLDERADLNTPEWNPFAHELRVLPFARVGGAVPPGPHSYVVIMTPDHRADELALRRLVRKRLRYLGVLGSARKAREMLEKLRADGIPAACLGRVHTPVGLPIASHTPAEIAISIAAQLILERNRQSSIPSALRMP